jgi:hypothetical protein
MADALSGQMTSNIIPMSITALRIQRWALQLPRASSWPRSKTWRMRRTFVNGHANFLVYSSAKALMQGHYIRSWEYLSTAIRLTPLCLFRPWIFHSICKQLRARMQRCSTYICF